MAQDKRFKIYYVDSSSRISSKLIKLFHNAGLEVNCFAGTGKCLERLALLDCDLLITNFKMPKITGVDLLKAAKQLLPCLSILVINSSRDFPHVIEAIKEGAIDFLRKPSDADVLVNFVCEFIEDDQEDILLYRSLTNREKNVLKLILLGKDSRESSLLLGCTKTTIDVHYSAIRKKFGVRNVKSIIVRAAQNGLVKFPKEQN